MIIPLLLLILIAIGGRLPAHAFPQGAGPTTQQLILAARQRRLAREAKERRDEWVHRDDGGKRPRNS